MTGALWLVTLSAVQPLQLALPALHSPGAPKATVVVITDVLVQELSKGGVHVTTESDMGTLLGAERQRQLLGCSTSSAQCMIELAGALGADGLITGTIGILGGSWVVALSIIGPDGAPLAGNSFTVSEGGLLEQIRSSARLLIDELRRKRPDRFPQATRSGPGVGTWVSGALGLVALGVGVGLLVDASSIKSSLINDPQALTSSADLQSQLSEGKTFQTVGWVAVGVGIAGVALAVVLAVLPHSTSDALAQWLQPSSTGGAFAWSARRP